MTQADQSPTAPARTSGRDLPAATVVGLALLAIVIVTLAYFPWGFVLLLCVLFSLGAVEVHQALGKIEMHSSIIPIVVGINACLAASYAAAQNVGGLGIPWHMVLLACLGFTVLASLVWRMFGGAEGYVRDSAASLFIVGYIALLGSFLSLLLAADNGPARIVTVLLCIAGSDTGGYAIGAWLGRHQMAPTISLKKTWEGLAGSILLASSTGAVAFTYLMQRPWWLGLIFGLLMVVSATAGDLIESLIKRDVGIKDMSSFLPGHGGVMDRLDSILASAPVAWFALYLMVPSA